MAFLILETMNDKQIVVMDVFGQTQTEETCTNYTCRHIASEHNNRNHKKCQCHTFKTAGASKKK